MASPAQVGCLQKVPKRVSGKAAESGILLDLGRTIRVKRLEMGFSQEALAHQAGIDRSHMGKIERGERNVTLLNIERIATVLKSDPSVLLSESGH